MIKMEMVKHVGRLSLGKTALSMKAKTDIAIPSSTKATTSMLG
jgi:hypothetical protein